MIIWIDNTVLPERGQAAAKQRISARISDGGGCSSGLFRRNSRISAEQMRSVADNSMEKQQKQRRRGARAVSDQMGSPRIFVIAGLDPAISETRGSSPRMTLSPGDAS
jgi:hypothetical protein